VKTLWFKGEFVNPILRGEKWDTVRPRSNRLPRVGDEVAFSVGPRPPFAFARVTAVEPSLDADRNGLVLSMCSTSGDMVRISFVLTSTPAPDRPHRPKPTGLRTQTSRSA